MLAHICSLSRILLILHLLAMNTFAHAGHMLITSHEGDSFNDFFPDLQKIGDERTLIINGHGGAGTPTIFDRHGDIDHNPFDVNFDLDQYLNDLTDNATLAFNELGSEIEPSIINDLIRNGAYDRELHLVCDMFPIEFKRLGHCTVPAHLAAQRMGARKSAIFFQAKVEFALFKNLTTGDVKPGVLVDEYGAIFELSDGDPTSIRRIKGLKIGTGFEQMSPHWPDLIAARYDPGTMNHVTINNQVWEIGCQSGAFGRARCATPATPRTPRAARIPASLGAVGKVVGPAEVVLGAMDYQSELPALQALQRSNGKLLTGSARGDSAVRAAVNAVSFAQVPAELGPRAGGLERVINANGKLGFAKMKHVQVIRGPAGYPHVDVYRGSDGYHYDNFGNWSPNSITEGVQGVGDSIKGLGYGVMRLFDFSAY